MSFKPTVWLLGLITLAGCTSALHYRQADSLNDDLTSYEDGPTVDSDMASLEAHIVEGSAYISQQDATTALSLSESSVDREQDLSRSTHSAHDPDSSIYTDGSRHGKHDSTRHDPEHFEYHSKQHDKQHNKQHHKSGGSAGKSSQHKNLWPPSALDVLGFLLACVTLFIAAAAGIGGGGVLVPLYVVFWSFSTGQAVALSNLTVASGALANLICNVRRRHPVADRPLIDWDLILVMEPAAMVGAVFGGFLTQTLPQWLTTCLLFGVLVFMSHNLWGKARKTWAKESAAKARAAEALASSAPDGDADVEDGQQQPLLAPELQTKNGETIQSIMAVGEAESNADREHHAMVQAKALLVRESQILPFGKLAVLVALFAWLLGTGILKGDVGCGSVQYWLLALAILPCALLVMGVVRQGLLRKQTLKNQVGLVPEKGDILWTRRTTLTYPAMCTLAGLVAGMFGVGGGIVKGPLLLHLGVLPDVQAATSATMILFTAWSACVVFVLFGGIKWDYAVLMIVAAFIVTTVGQLLTFRIIAQLGRRSIVIIAMGILLTLGAVIMGIESGIYIKGAYPHSFLEHGSICDPGHGA